MTAAPRIALLIGSDAVTRNLIATVTPGRPDLLIVEDRSLGPKKILRLLLRRRVKPTWLLQQALSRARQAAETRGTGSEIPMRSVRNNAELQDLLRAHPSVQKLICFRAGLILHGSIMERVPCLNIHCARLPDYPGLGAIRSAMDREDYGQKATLHRVTRSIDEGEILREKPYVLRPELPYWRNELIAYRAGAELLAEVLRGLQGDF
jgi:methionyl-tRNA formyltransferase